MTAIMGIFCDACRKLLTTDQTDLSFALMRADAKKHGWHHNRLVDKDFCCDACRLANANKPEEKKS
jgi:hypothetical protein